MVNLALWRLFSILSLHKNLRDQDSIGITVISFLLSPYSFGKIASCLLELLVPFRSKLMMTYARFVCDARQRGCAGAMHSSALNERMRPSSI